MAETARAMRRLLLGAAALLLLGSASTPEYSIEAIRYADSPGDSVAEMVIGAPKNEKIDTVYALWLIRGGGRNILFDSGFHRPRWFKEWTIKNYLRPDEAVRLAGVKPEDVTDVVISHAHWDHMGGIDLFPKAVVWIQKDEYRYYTADAWQSGATTTASMPTTSANLVRLNTDGRLRLADGDDGRDLCRDPGPTGKGGIPTLPNTCEWTAIHHRSSWPQITCICIATSPNTNPAPPSAPRITRRIFRTKHA